jgi:glutamyl/glutaminyl-tRNA synthetase
MALVNQHMAHSTGGKFIVRFDDNTRYWMSVQSGEEGMQRIADQQLSDLSVMELEIDEVVYQSEQEEKVRMYLASSRFQDVTTHAHDGTWETGPVIGISPTISPQRVYPLIVAEKVVLDKWNDVDLVIRGVELLQEHSFYIYLCALFGFRFPQCHYLPRLMCTSDDGPISNVSKTMGNWKVRDCQ